MTYLLGNQSMILKRIFLMCFLDCIFRVTLFRQVDSFSATYNVLLLPATEPSILFSSQNKFINEQRRILSNSVSKQAPTLLGTSLKILKYSKDKLTTENKWKFSKLHRCYISLVVNGHSRSIYTLRNRLCSISWHNYAIATKQFPFFLS